MKLRPIPASEFTLFSESAQDILRKCGAVAVNDKLLPIWDQDNDIGLYHGGRGGGKSEGVADKLLDECLTEDYFNCYYGRKVFDSVRGTSFSTFIHSIKKNNLTPYFSYSEADSSSMIIRCHNGNKFIPFGSDRPDKLKSIKDPTHIWCEELDQFEFNDFKQLYPTLRTPRGRNVFIGTFNNYEVLPDHWILKIFYSNLYRGTDKNDIQNIDLLQGKKIKKIHINFYDNYFIDQKDYEQKLWLSAAGNSSIFDGLAGGAWGINSNDNPWAFAFDRKKHISASEIHASREKFLYCCFDFNRSPATCVIIQWDGFYEIKIIEVIKLFRSGTEAICDKILEDYQNYVYIVNGDYSGNTPSSIFEEEVSNYTMIKNKLNLSDKQIQIEPNPSVKRNQLLVNSVLFKLNIQICPVKARPMIFDFENVKKMPDGTIDKSNRKDPTKQGDVLDCFTGDTLIATDKGQKEIFGIEVGEFVLTRNGYKPVIDKWSSIAEVYEFEFQGGLKVKCTRNHKFYDADQNEFIGIDTMFESNHRVCFKEPIHPIYIGLSIIKMIYLGKKEVYDITIQDEHEFFANGILVHNCFRYFCNQNLKWVIEGQ